MFLPLADRCSSKKYSDYLSDSQTDLLANRWVCFDFVALGLNSSCDKYIRPNIHSYLLCKSCNVFFCPAAMVDYIPPYHSYVKKLWMLTRNRNHMKYVSCIHVSSNRFL